MALTISIAYLLFGLASTSTISVLPLYIIKNEDVKRLVYFSEFMSLSFLIYFLVCMIVDFGGVSRLLTAIQNPSPNSILPLVIVLLIISLALHSFLFCYILTISSQINYLRYSLSILTFSISIFIVLFLTRLQWIFAGDSYPPIVLGCFAFASGMFFISQSILFLACKLDSILSSRASKDNSLITIRKQTQAFFLMFLIFLLAWKIAA